MGIAIHFLSSERPHSVSTRRRGRTSKKNQNTSTTHFLLFSIFIFFYFFNSTDRISSFPACFFCPQCSVSTRRRGRTSSVCSSVTPAPARPQPPESQSRDGSHRVKGLRGSKPREGSRKIPGFSPKARPRPPRVVGGGEIVRPILFEIFSTPRKYRPSSRPQREEIFNEIS